MSKETLSADIKDSMANETLNLQLIDSDTKIKELKQSIRDFRIN
jgi:hypothetical protein